MRSPLFISVLFFIVLLTFAGCREDSQPAKVVRRLFQKHRDTTACRLDSAFLQYNLDRFNVKGELRLALDSFYLERAFEAAFFNNFGLNEYAGSLINLLNNEEPAQLGSTSGKHRPDSLFRELADIKRPGCSDSLLQTLEALLTVKFFEYASRNWGGVDADISKRTGWFIVRKEIDYAELLSDFLSNRKQFRVKEPVYRQYMLLKQHLRKYHDIEQTGTWFDPGEISAEAGDSSAAVIALKKLLFLTDDLAVSDTGMVFDSLLTDALKNFQSRHGLQKHGRLDKNTLSALRVPVSERVQQLLINMERSRWVPLDVRGKYVIVNIPEFRMYVYEHDLPLWSCNVIVGKSNPINKTVVFNDSIELVVFSPYWNIPKNIMLHEIIPALQEDKKYLEKNNMEVVDRHGTPIDEKFDWDEYTDHFPYIIRERPGPTNSLGQVKFLFPNSFDIYLHDTPAKTLFSKQKRAFSHGCIRIEQPVEFAQYLLSEDSAWTEERILEMMNGGSEVFVRIRKKVPVFIAYFTAWVDRNNRLNFRDDVYGHDNEMKQLLFVN